MIHDEGLTVEVCGEQVRPQDNGERFSRLNF
jgi:hypothetical protein